jgi:uncharacterized protein (DUF342 family)
MVERKPYGKTPKVVIDAKGMRAAIIIARPDSDEDEPIYTLEDFMSMLARAGVTYGISQKTLQFLTRDPEYDHEILVAEGVPPVEGKDGYYEYHFSQKFSNKPTIRPDGSADFLSIKMLEVVHEGELLATYHPSQRGKDGTTVRGVRVEPKRVRDLPPIGGRGFHRSEDNLSYYSDMDGKIVLQNNRIMISPVLEIEGDADMTIGNIEFKGDVVIHGGIKNGVKIQSTGTITVYGLVEHCSLEAGRDIFLLSGVKGAEKTNIHAEWGITAEFIEYAAVSCKKDLRADVIFNCLVNCDSRIIVTSGKRAAIIGGYVTAVKGISALNIGNKFGTVTHINVGLDENRIREMQALETKIENMEESIHKIKCGIEEFERMSEEHGVSYREDPRRLQLLRVKIRDEAVVAEDKLRLQELTDLMECAQHATVRAYGTVYAGVAVKISDMSVKMSDYQPKVEFIRTERGIHLERLDEPIPDE